MPLPLYSEDPADRHLVTFLGPNSHGVPLEVIAIELAAGDLLVIHGMKLRRRNRDAYALVMSWANR